MENYGTARQAIHNNTVRLMRTAFCVTEATDTHSEYVICIAFHGHKDGTNAP